MEILRKKEKKILEIKNIIIKMKNAFDGVISRLDMTEVSISELEEMSIETSKAKKLRAKWLKKIELNI